MRLIQNLFCLIVSCSICHGVVQERDWMNDWPQEELRGTEHLPSFNLNSLSDSQFYVTYALDGGRFCDQLMNYIQAYYISWKFNIPLIYRPFDYSDALILSTAHTLEFNTQTLSLFSAKLEFINDKKTIKKIFNNLELSTFNLTKSKVLWSIGLLTPFLEERVGDTFDDENFRSVLKKLVYPKQELASFELPADRLSVALHIRTGVGYDLDVNIRNMPTKFPSLAFYLGSLKHVAKLFSGIPLYVHVFTDHPNTQILKKRIEEGIVEWEIQEDLLIGVRENGNHHSQNVLEDLFMMTKFDCIIHPDSSVSRVATLLSGPLIEARPFNWGVYRKDSNGSPIFDKNGELIVDPMIVFRSIKGKNVYERRLMLLEDRYLFDRK